MAGTNDLVNRKGALTLTAKVWSKSLAGQSSRGFTGKTAALFIRMSMDPNSFFTCLTKFLISSSTVRSAVLEAIRPDLPRAFSSSVNRSRGRDWRAVRKRSTSSSAIFRATARPRPPEVPVIRHFFPDSEILVMGLPRDLKRVFGPQFLGDFFFSFVILDCAVAPDLFP